MQLIRWCWGWEQVNVKVIVNLSLFNGKMHQLSYIYSLRGGNNLNQKTTMSSRRVFNIYANWDCMCNTQKYLHKPTLSFLPCQLESSTTKLRTVLLQSKSQGWSLEDLSVMQSTQPVRSLNCKQKSQIISEKGSSGVLQETRV